jgi:hypothetical protein
MRSFTKGRLKGRSPFKTHASPSPRMERGIQGVRLINNVYNLITLIECDIVPVLKIAILKGGK